MNLKTDNNNTDDKTFSSSGWVLCCPPPLNPSFPQGSPPQSSCHPSMPAFRPGSIPLLKHQCCYSIHPSAHLLSISQSIILSTCLDIALLQCYFEDATQIHPKIGSINPTICKHYYSTILLNFSCYYYITVVLCAEVGHSFGQIKTILTHSSA